MKFTILGKKYRTFTILLRTDTRTPALEVMNFTILVYSSLTFIITILSVCLIYDWIFKETMHFHDMYMTYMATPQDKNPCLGGHEI